MSHLNDLEIDLKDAKLALVSAVQELSYATKNIKDAVSEINNLEKLIEDEKLIQPAEDFINDNSGASDSLNLER